MMIQVKSQNGRLYLDKQIQVKVKVTFEVYQMTIPANQYWAVRARVLSSAIQGKMK